MKFRTSSFPLLILAFGSYLTACGGSNGGGSAGAGGHAGTGSGGQAGTGSGGQAGTASGGQAGTGTGGQAGAGTGGQAGTNAGGDAGTGAGGQAGTSSSGGDAGTGAGGQAGTSAGGQAGTSAGGQAGTSAGGHAGTGAGGSAGSADGGGFAAFSYTFDTGTSGFALTANVADGGAPATLTWDSAVGSPHPGSLKLTGTFNNFNQGMNVQVGVSPPANLTGKIIHAQVMLDPADAQAFGGTEVQVHASSAGFVYAAGAELHLSPGVWTDVTLDLGAPFYAAAGFDPTQIVQVGVNVGTGTVSDGGVFPEPENLTFHIDSIVAE